MEMIFLSIQQNICATGNMDLQRQNCVCIHTITPTRIVTKLKGKQEMYFYSKTNQMHNISNLFYFGTTLYMFRTFLLSIIRSIRLYIQHQVYVIQVLWQPQNLYDIKLMLYVQS